MKANHKRYTYYTACMSWFANIAFIGKEESKVIKGAFRNG